MTGEFYATLLGHTILGALRKEPDAQSGFEKGLRAAKRGGGLTHQAFAARTAVLMGDMTGEEVAPFLSGLLIGAEIENACALYSNTQAITLIAEGVIAENYKTALAAKDLTCNVMTPEAAFIKGLFQLTPKG
jgi:2-dehydro-3-deoxygalactonokinase